MTKKELIRNLMNSEGDLNEEMLVSIEYIEGFSPVLVPIGFIGGQFINVTVLEEIYSQIGD